MKKRPQPPTKRHSNTPDDGQHNREGHSELNDRRREDQDDPTEDTTETPSTADKKRLSGSSTTTSSTREMASRVKSVRFQNKVHVHEVISFLSLPPEIVAAIWFQESDYGRIIRDNKRTVEFMVSDDNQIKSNRSSICERGLECQTPERWSRRENLKKSSRDAVLDMQRDQKEKMSKKHKPPQYKSRLRKDGNTDAAGDQHATEKSLSTSQDNDRDQKALATAYRKITEVPQDIAHMKGLMDEREAFRIHEAEIANSIFLPRKRRIKKQPSSFASSNRWSDRSTRSNSNSARKRSSFPAGSSRRLGGASDEKNQSKITSDEAAPFSSRWDRGLQSTRGNSQRKSKRDLRPTHTPLKDTPRSKSRTNINNSEERERPRRKTKADGEEKPVNGQHGRRDSTVGFSDKVEYIHESEKNFDKLRVSPEDVWYTKKEISRMKAVRKNIRKNNVNNKKDDNGGAEDDDGGISDGDNPDDLRGFEHVLHGDQRKEQIKKAWDTVLNEQHRLHAKRGGADSNKKKKKSVPISEADSEALAKVYKACTIDSVDVAFKRARQDEEIACDVLKEDRELERKRRREREKAKKRQLLKKRTSPRTRTRTGAPRRGRSEDNSRNFTPVPPKRSSLPTVSPTKRFSKQGLDIAPSDPRTSDVAPVSPRRQPTLRNVHNSNSRVHPPERKPSNKREFPVSPGNMAPLFKPKRSHDHDYDAEKPKRRSGSERQLQSDQPEPTGSPKGDKKMSTRIFEGLLRTAPMKHTRQAPTSPSKKKINNDNGANGASLTNDEDFFPNKSTMARKKKVGERFRVPAL